MFSKHGDYAGFEKVLVQGHERVPMRTLAYCIMPNHWHLVLWPKGDGDLSEFMRWLTVTHTQRWHAHHGTSGSGHLYQGRYKSFPVETDSHFLTVCGYVERNALRAGLVQCAEDWRWCSLWQLRSSNPEMRRFLAEWPIPRPSDWVEWVNQAHNDRELAALRLCVARGRPFGNNTWIERMVKQLALQFTLHPRGRPRKKQD